MNDHPPVTDGPAERGARAAAQRLAADHGPGLEAEVEAALHTLGRQRQPQQYFDPISLGSLIVSVAALAWTVYNDLRKKTNKPSRDLVERRVRVELPATDQVTPAERDRIIGVVVDEVVENADE